MAAASDLALQEKSRPGDEVAATHETGYCAVDVGHLQYVFQLKYEDIFSL